MSRVLGEPDGIFTRLDSHQKQINDLKRTSQLSAANITDGTLQVSDPAGNVRVQVGNIPDGDYGLAISDLAGHTEEILPSVHAYNAATLSTTSTTATAITGSPTVSAVIGASGDAEITISAFVQVTTATTAFAALYIDGVLAGPTSCFDLVAGTGGAGVAMSTTLLLSLFNGATIAPGSHTFSLKYLVGSGTGTWSQNYLRVKPI